MKNFKTKDLMITISPEKTNYTGVYNCEHKSKPDTGGTQCTTCTHNTNTTCVPHSKKPPKKYQMNDSLKAIELKKLKAAISGLQNKEYA